MAPVYDHRGAVQAGVKEHLVRFDLERIRHVAVGIGNHAIRGNDGVGFDTAWDRHAGVAERSEYGEVLQQ
jgi:hypothetical protein